MEHTRQGLIGGAMEQFAREAHWFEFSELWDIPKVVRDFGREMALKGLLDLPYAKTIFWCSRRVGGGKEIALLCDKSEMPDGPIMAAFGITQEEIAQDAEAKQIRVRLMMERDPDTSMLFPPFYMSTASGNTAFRREDVGGGA